jgi:hypothetical protein
METLIGEKFRNLNNFVGQFRKLLPVRIKSLNPLVYVHDIEFLRISAVIEHLYQSYEICFSWWKKCVTC